MDKTKANLALERVAHYKITIDQLFPSKDKDTYSKYDQEEIFTIVISEKAFNRFHVKLLELVAESLKPTKEEKNA